MTTPATLRGSRYTHSVTQHSPWTPIQSAPVNQLSCHCCGCCCRFCWSCCMSAAWFTLMRSGCWPSLKRPSCESLKKHQSRLPTLIAIVAQVANAEVSIVIFNTYCLQCEVKESSWHQRKLPVSIDVFKVQIHMVMNNYFRHFKWSFVAFSPPATRSVNFSMRRNKCMRGLLTAT